MTSASIPLFFLCSWLFLFGFPFRSSSSNWDPSWKKYDFHGLLCIGTTCSGMWVHMFHAAFIYFWDARATEMMFLMASACCSVSHKKIQLCPIRRSRLYVMCQPKLTARHKSHLLSSMHKLAESHWQLHARAIDVPT